MRRLLCALVALCIAMPAWAGRVLLIKPSAPTAANGGNTVMGKRMATITDVLNTLGVDYDIVDQTVVAARPFGPPGHVNQGAIINGRVSFNEDSSIVRQYAGVIHTWFTNGGSGVVAGSGIGRIPGYNPDTLTKAASWPTIPSMFIGICNQSSGTQYSSSANCSTGVHAGWPTGSGVDGTGQSQDWRGRNTMRLVGSNLAWNQGGTHTYYYITGRFFEAHSNGETISSTDLNGTVVGSVAKGDTVVTCSATSGVTATENVTVGGKVYEARVTNGLATAILVQRGLHILHSTPGITKSRVTIGANSAAFRDNGLSSCIDCDSSGIASNYFDLSADTAVIWTRQRSTTDNAPLIFLLGSDHSNAGTELDSWNIAMAVAIMDSAAGGTIIGQKAGWNQPKLAFVIDGAFNHSKSNVNSGFWNTHGEAPSDSTFLKMALDSIATLAVPVVVAINIDSVGQYPYEKAWWAGRLPLARFTIDSRGGIDSLSASNFGVLGNVGRYTSPDIFGRFRLRTLITSDRYDNGTACDGTDTTLSCILAYAKQRLDSIPEFQGRGSSTIVAPYGDYYPRGRATGLSADSLAMAMWRSGFDTAINQTIFPDAVAGMQWGLSSGGAVGQTTSGPFSAFPNPRTQTVKAAGQGAILTRFKWLNMRHDVEDFTEDFWDASHNNAGDFWNGWFGSPWYNTDLPYWNHTFRTKLSVMFIRPGELGWTASATSNMVRPGWYWFKATVNQARAVNALAGRQIISFVYPEDLDP